MIDDQPIATNPFPVPIEETAPKWWLEEPEPIYPWRPSLIELLVIVVIISVIVGLISGGTSLTISIDSHDRQPEVSEASSRTGDSPGERS